MASTIVRSFFVAPVAGTIDTDNPTGVPLPTGTAVISNGAAWLTPARDAYISSTKMYGTFAMPRDTVTDSSISVSALWNSIVFDGTPPCEGSVILTHSGWVIAPTTEKWDDQETFTDTGISISLTSQNDSQLNTTTLTGFTDFTINADDVISYNITRVEDDAGDTSSRALTVYGLNVLYNAYIYTPPEIGGD